MAETIDARVNFLQRQLHAIGLALEQARGRKDAATIVSLRALFNKLNAEIVALQAEAKAKDMPSSFMLTLDALSDEAIKTGLQFRDAGVTIVSGAASLVKYLPLILAVALIVVGLVYAGKIRKDLK